MVEAPFARQDIHKPKVDTVHGHGAGDRLERGQPPHFAEPPARLGLLLQHLERQPARSAQVTTAFLGQSGEVRRLLVRLHPSALEQHFQLLVRDDRIQVAAALGEAHARVHHRRVGAVQALQVASLRRDRRRHRREVGDELRVPRLHGLHDHWAGAPDQRAPPLVRPQREVLFRDQLIPQHAAVHRAEPRRVAGVDQLLRRSRVEIGRRLHAENERRPAGDGQLERAGQVALGHDRVVGTGGKAQPTARAHLVHDAHLLALDGDGGGGTHSHTRHAGDALGGLNPEVH